jgi:Protein of unknown function (DUF4232)
MPTSRHRGAALAAATVVVSALALTACGGTSSSSSKSSTSPSTSGSKASSAASAAPSAPGGTDGPATGQDGGPTAAPATGFPARTGDSGTAMSDAKQYVPPSTPSAVPRCHTKDLAVSFETGGDAAPDTTSDAQQTTGIAVRNSSGHTCAIGGFPGLDLTGGSVTWSLSRKAAGHGSVTLAPGDTTDFQITFLPEPRGAWTPSRVTVTPPDEDTAKTLAWPWGPVLLQDGATHPGTYVGPIG